MRVIRLVACLVAFSFVMVAAPELASAGYAKVSAHHTQGRHKHRKRARRRHRKHAKNKSGLEF